MRCLAALATGVLALLPVAGCGGKSPPAPPVQKARAESDLAVTTISADAYRSLRIISQTATTGPVQEHLPLTGWIMAKQGYEVTLTAPVAGYVRLADGLQRSPRQGEAVARDQELLAIEPVLSPVEHIQKEALRFSIDSELKKARETEAAAKKERDRAKLLFDQKLRGDQEWEQAQLKHKHAEADLTAAQEKMKLFATSLRRLPAPRAGTVVTVHVSPDQYVPAAAPLLTLVDLTELWVRVPVPEFDLPMVSARQTVTVKLKSNGDDGNDKGWSRCFQATPLALVPQVDPARHTADLIYELSPYSLEARGQQAVHGLANVAAPLFGATLMAPPRRTPFAKDQMVTVHVPLGQKRVETVVPYAAIVFDAFGGTWIYLERTESGAAVHRFERRRVEMGPNVAGGVVIRPTLAAADRVVVSGAAFLFSSEFHSPPVPAPPAPGR